MFSLHHVSKTNVSCDCKFFFFRFLYCFSFIVDLSLRKSYVTFTTRIKILFKVGTPTV